MTKANYATKARSPRKNRTPESRSSQAQSDKETLKLSVDMSSKGEKKTKDNRRGDLDKDNTAKPHKEEDSKDDDKDREPMTWQLHLLEYGKAILLAIIMALIIRSFLIQAFMIPSGSMIPTLLVGDRVLVSKFAYGVRNPFSNKVLFKTGTPERGDVVIFKSPPDPKVDFVKRVVGLPGEEVEVKNGEIYINSQIVSDPHGYFRGSPFSASRNFGPVVVPENQYFVMGDNRDFSSDSRVWGFVDTAMLRGKAWRLYWSWDSDDKLPVWKRLRFSRLGLKIL